VWSSPTLSALAKRINVASQGWRSSNPRLKLGNAFGIQIRATPFLGCNQGLPAAFKLVISADVRRRAQSIVSDKSIDGQTRGVIRYGLEVNDRWLPELVRRVDAGESITEAIAVLAESPAN